MEEKSCANCKHSKNIRFFENEVEWKCENTPHYFLGFLKGDYETEFKTFYCSNYENVFTKERVTS